MTPGEAELIINAYGRILESSCPVSGGTVADEKKLPFPKEQIKAAILFGLQSATSKEQRAVLRNAFLFLADFQKRIGGQDIGLNLTNVDVAKLDDNAMRAMAKNISDNTDSWNRWLAQAEAERKLLEEELKASGF